MPEMGESVTEGTVLEWHVSVGDVVEEGQTLVEVSTDKVDAEVPAPRAGRITKLCAEPDDEVAVGEPLAELDPNDTAGGESAQDAGTDAASANGSGNGSAPAPPSGGEGRATPLARRVAAAEGVVLGSVDGSGPGGKVR